MYVDLDEERLGQSYETGEELLGCFVAIAHYENNLPRVYIFLVSENFDVIGDFLCASVEDAQTGHYYGAIKRDWIRVAAKASSDQ